MTGMHSFEMPNFPGAMVWEMTVMMPYLFRDGTTRASNGETVMAEREDSYCVGLTTVHTMAPYSVRLGHPNEKRDRHRGTYLCPSLFHGFARGEFRKGLERDVRSLLRFGQAHERKPMGAGDSALFPAADGRDCLLQRVGDFSGIAEGFDD
jgi:hypothetical protein